MKKIYIILLITLVGCSQQVQPTPVEPSQPPITPPVVEPIEEPVVSIELKKVEDLTVEDFLNEKAIFQPPTLDGLLEMINQDQDLSFMQATSPAYDDLLMFSDPYNEAMSNYFLRMGNLETITSQQAIQDVEFLGDLFIRAYGGINQFGGKTRVQQMIDQAKDFFSTHEVIELHRFEEYLAFLTSFIHDTHYVMVDGSPILDASILSYDDYWDELDDIEAYPNKPIYAENLKLVRNEQNQLVDSENSKVVLIDESLVKPLIIDNEYFESIVLVNTFDEIEKIDQIKYEDNTFKDLRYKEIENLNMGDEYRTGPYDNVFYVNFTYGALGRESIEHFEEKIVDINQYPYLVVDLRYNSGGYITAAYPLIYQLFGDIYLDQKDPVSYYYVDPLTQEQVELNKNLSNPNIFVTDHHYVDHFRYKSLDSTQRLIIVLTDFYTASAGEFVTGMLKAGEKTVVLGTQTMGLATSNIGRMYTLPNSDIPLRLPSTFYYYNPLEYSVDKGYQPDIYTNISNVMDFIDLLNNLKE